MVWDGSFSHMGYGMEFSQYAQGVHYLGSRWARSLPNES